MVRALLHRLRVSSLLAAPLRLQPSACRVRGIFAHLFAALRRHEVLLAEISQSEEKFRALMAALPDPVVIIDQSLKINFVNTAAEQLYGYKAGGMNGLDIRNLMAPQNRQHDLEGMRWTFANWKTSHGIHGLERIAMRRDGREFAVEINATTYESPAGRMLITVIRDIEKRREKDRALSRSRENLARAQRVAGVGSFEVDFVTGERNWSDEFMRIWGVTHKPQQGAIEFLTRLIHPEDRQKFTAGREAVLAGKDHPTRDFRIIRPDGAERILHNEYSTDFDEDGRPLRLFGTIQDVTERKQIELELRRSRENLARAQRIAGIGSFERNLLTGEIELSDELYRIHGVAKGTPEARVEFLHTLVHPEDRERVEEFRRSAAAGQPSPPIDYRIIRPDGTERVLHRECEILFDEGGRPIGLCGTLQDVTERKKIEDELRRSRENLARAQQIAGIGSFERNLVTGEGEWSDEFMRIWGLERIPPGRLHQTLLTRVHPDDRQKFVEARNAVLQNKPVPAIDFRIVGPNGEERIVHPEYRAIFDEQGKPIRMFGTVQDITERKKTENELRRSRENLARAQQIAGIGSFERDLITGKFEWSDEFLHIWGLTERPTRGMAETLLSIVHPEDRQKFIEGRDAALKRENSSLDFRIIRSDGEERILHRDYGVVFDQAGKAVRMFGTVQDITERKRIEIEMQRSRENLALAQRLAAMGSFEQDLITGQAEWSDEMYRILGVEPGTFVTGPEALAALMHPDDRESFWAARKLEIQGKAGPAIEFRIIRRDGTERIVRRESAVVCDDAGRPIRLHGTFADVTERKKIETELRRSRENLARAQRLAGIGSFARDLATGEGEWSDEMYHVLGLDKTAGVPPIEAIIELTHPDDRQQFIERRAADIAGQPGKPLEHRIVRPDGTERIVRRETAVLYDDEKRPIRLFGTLQDVTERRLAERRERELERQLLHSQKLEALGTLAGGIAHDLNNTLVPIMALSKLTARRFEPGSLIRTNLETIYEASERARDLVKRVVAFSRKDDVEKRETDMAEIVAEALKLLRATIPSSITLEAQIKEVPTLLADASQVHQIVTNLVSNASQAIGGEIGTIMVGLDAITNPLGQKEIRLSVSDTGMGMDEATQQRIFEPFFTTRAVGQGTGLGLSIVHGIVTGHGGHIAVTSAPGKGTRIDLYFPAAAADAPFTSSRPAA
jgi:PAS domain S-box-containing protein